MDWSEFEAAYEREKAAYAAYRDEANPPEGQRVKPMVVARLRTEWLQALADRGTIESRIAIELELEHRWEVAQRYHHETSEPKEAKR